MMWQLAVLHGNLKFFSIFFAWSARVVTLVQAIIGRGEGNQAIARGCDVARGFGDGLAVPTAVRDGLGEGHDPRRRLARGLTSDPR